VTRSRARPRSATIPNGRFIDFQYDANGNLTGVTPPQKPVHLFDFNAVDLLSTTNRWSAAKGDTKYKYDPVGNLTNVDYAASTDVKFQHDPLNRVTNMIDAAGTTKYAYTLAGFCGPKTARSATTP
jgi:YD repeat-containing protein